MKEKLVKNTVEFKKIIETRFNWTKIINYLVVRIVRYQVQFIDSKSNEPENHSLN